MGEIRTEPYSAEKEAAWDAFVDASVNGTIFHRRRFLAYHSPERFDDRSLLLYDGGSLRAVFPAAAQQKGDARVLRSHPGASYGGLVVARPPGVREAFDLVDALLAHARAECFDRLEFRTAPRIFSGALCDELELAWLHRGVHVAAHELSTFYDLRQLDRDPDDEAITRTFSAPCRRACRSAQRAGIQARPCDSDDELAEYHSMLGRNLDKHRATPTHSLAELVDLKRRFPEDVQLVGAFDGGQMVGGIVALFANRYAAHCFYFASRAEAQAKRPLNLAVLALIRMCAQRGLRFVNFGISTEDSGQVVNWGLFRFKESFGGGGVMRHYWVGHLGGGGA